MSVRTFGIGERVEWDCNGATRRGRVVRVATESGRLGDYVFDASSAYPRYVVQEDGGGRAALRAEALRHAREPPPVLENSYGG